MGEPIRIVVCVKQVVDPEAPASSFKVDAASRTIAADGVPPVINPYDESALEVALRIKEALPETKITAVGLGAKLARPVMMKALAVGADELYLLEDSTLSADSRATASVLAAAIRRIGFDLVLAGRQASDTNSGTVGLLLATLLGVPAVTWARKAEIDGSGLKVERVIPEGYETLRGQLPALVTVSHEAGQLRTPKLMDIRKAKQKPVQSLTIAELGIKMPERAVELVGLQPQDRKRHCRIIEGENQEQVGANLAKKLVEDGVLGF